MDFAKYFIVLNKRGCGNKWGGGWLENILKINNWGVEIKVGAGG